MAAFQGGQRSAGVNSNKWQQKYQTMRAKKLKGEAVTSTVERGQRPGAFTMMRDFYKGYADVSLLNHRTLSPYPLLSFSPSPFPLPFHFPTLSSSHILLFLPSSSPHHLHLPHSVRNKSNALCLY